MTNTLSAYATYLRQFGGAPYHEIIALAKSCATCGLTATLDLNVDALPRLNAPEGSGTFVATKTDGSLLEPLTLMCFGCALKYENQTPSLPSRLVLTVSQIESGLRS